MKHKSSVQNPVEQTLVIESFRCDGRRVLLLERFAALASHTNLAVPQMGPLSFCVGRAEQTAVHRPLLRFEASARHSQLDNVGRAVADNKSPSSGLGLVTQAYGHAGQKGRNGQRQQQSLFLWLKYAEPVQTLGKSQGIERLRLTISLDFETPEAAVELNQRVFS